MNNTVFVKEYSLPCPNIPEIFRYARCPEPTEAARTLLSSVIGKYGACFSGKICYAEFDITKSGDTLDLGFCKTESKDIIKNLSGCSSVVLFAATVGHEVDRLTKRLALMSPAQAVLLDALGSERVEALCDCFNNDIKRLCKEKSVLCKPRFSPGYGDWRLSVQKDIFTALNPTKYLGITLSDSLLMSPLKSVTAIIGTGDAIGESL